MPTSQFRDPGLSKNREEGEGDKSTKLHLPHEHTSVFHMVKYKCPLNMPNKYKNHQQQKHQI